MVAMPNKDGAEGEFRMAVRRFAAAAMLALAIACLVVVPTAHAATKIVGDLGIAAPDTLEVGCVDLIPLDVACDPSSIQTGIACGMTEMCGQDPCLCGKPDEYGACACNGLTTTYPTVTADSNNTSAVRVVYLFGKPYLFTLAGSCAATVTVTGSLLHYNDATATVQVTVAPFGLPDVGRILIVLAVLVAVVGLVFLIVRGIRKLLKLIIRRKGKADEQA